MQRSTPAITEGLGSQQSSLATTSRKAPALSSRFLSPSTVCSMKMGLATHSSSRGTSMVSTSQATTKAATVEVGSQSSRKTTLPHDSQSWGFSFTIKIAGISTGCFYIENITSRLFSRQRFHLLRLHHLSSHPLQRQVRPPERLVRTSLPQ